MIPILADNSKAIDNIIIPVIHRAYSIISLVSGLDVGSLLVLFDLMSLDETIVQINIPNVIRIIEKYSRNLYRFFKIIMPNIMLAMREPDRNIMCKGIDILKLRA